MANAIGDREALCFEKEMGTTHREFFRLLPAALGGDEYRVDGRVVTVGGGGRRLTITLSAEAERRIASLVLPVTHVRLVLTGYPAEEAAAVLARFDRAFQRGGG